jgi:hypothetical protein
VIEEVTSIDLTIFSSLVSLEVSILNYDMIKFKEKKKYKLITNSYEKMESIDMKTILGLEVLASKLRALTISASLRSLEPLFIPFPLLISLNLPNNSIYSIPQSFSVRIYLHH